MPPPPPTLPPLPSAHGDPGLPPGHPPVSALPQATAPTAEPSAPLVVASGVVQIAAAVQAQVKQGATLFLSARQAVKDQPPGALVLAKKLRVAGTSIAFSLTTADFMGAEAGAVGPVRFFARFDQDDDASTKQVGDVEGETQEITLPARDVQVLLQTVRMKAAEATSNDAAGLGAAGHGAAGHGSAGHGASALPAGHP